MAFKEQSLDLYEAEKDVVDRLAKYKDPFNYNADVSLAKLSDSAENIKTKATVKDVAGRAYEAADNDYAKAIADHAALKKRMKAHVVADKGNNSDEFVILGGTRQVDITAAQVLARENKKKAEALQKAEDEKKKVDEEKDKPK